MFSLQKHVGSKGLPRTVEFFLIFAFVLPLTCKVPFKVSGAAEMAKQSTNRVPQYCCQMFSVFSLFKGPRVPFQRQLSRCTPQQPHCPSAKGGADPGLPRRHPGIFDSTDFPGDGAANSISKGGERQHLGLKPCYAKPKWTVPVRSSQTGHGGL